MCLLCVWAMLRAASARRAVNGAAWDGTQERATRRPWCVSSHAVCRPATCSQLRAVREGPSLPSAEGGMRSFVLACQWHGERDSALTSARVHVQANAHTAHLLAAWSSVLDRLGSLHRHLQPFELGGAHRGSHALRPLMMRGNPIRDLARDLGTLACHFADLRR